MKFKILFLFSLDKPKNKHSISHSNPVKRKCYIGDFSLSDLDSPRKRFRYWKTTNNCIKTYKKKLSASQKKNFRLLKKIQNLNNLASHLKDNKLISEECFALLKVELKNINYLSLNN